MEYEKCYVYEPEQRPAKRRKTEASGLHASWPTRRDAYRKAWRARQALIDARLKGVYSQAVDRVSEFLEQSLDNQTPKIPTAILCSDPDASSYSAVIDDLSQNKEFTKKRVLITVSISSGGNLKALLKTIIRKATSLQGGDDDDDEEAPAQRKGRRLLNYDLQLLADYCDERQLEEVILSIHEVEAFDSSLLSDLIEHLRYWNDRIPFILLLSIATSPETLQQRLSSTAVGSLDGQLIDIATEASECEATFDALLDETPPIWIGADLLRAILERQSDYVQSNESFVHALRFAYMSHYYANALAIFLIPDMQCSKVPADHFEALRNVRSFREYCRRLMDDGDVHEVAELLDDNKKLFDLAAKSIARLREQLSDMLAMISFIQNLQRCLQPPGLTTLAKTPLGELYNFAFSGRLSSSSSIVRTMLLTIRKSPASVVARLLDLEPERTTADFLASTKKLKQELAKLSSSTDNRELRSEFDIHNSTLRTTVVAQKVELSKQKATLSKQDEAYTELLKEYSDLLESLFSQTLIDPKDLLFNELVVYDLRSPFRETFTPKPRHAIERALASPHDYLDCDCCGPDGSAGDVDATLSASQPTTAVLYQLYLESGSLINVSDLQQAFNAVVGGNGQSEEEMTASFQRSLAELRFFGMVKPTRKRADHVGKVAWRGL